MKLEEDRTEDRMKKRLIGFLMAGVMAAGVLAGCGKGAENGGQTETGVRSTGDTQESEDGVGGNVVVTAWYDNDEAMMNAIADVVNAKLSDENITLRFEKKSDLTSQIQLYGTDAQNGPDMYLFAHDSLGGFAEMGILEPVGNLIAPEKEADLIPMTIEAASYKGEQYLLPVYYETLLFIYNKNL